jgi:hypothetical protein
MKIEKYLKNVENIIRNFFFDDDVAMTRHDSHSTWSIVQFIDVSEEFTSAIFRLDSCWILAWLTLLNQC